MEVNAVTEQIPERRLPASNNERETEEGDPHAGNPDYRKVRLAHLDLIRTAGRPGCLLATIYRSCPPGFDNGYEAERKEENGDEVNHGRGLQRYWIIASKTQLVSLLGQWGSLSASEYDISPGMICRSHEGILRDIYADVAIERIVTSIHEVNHHHQGTPRSNGSISSVRLSESSWIVSGQVLNSGMDRPPSSTWGAVRGRTGDEQRALIAQRCESVFEGESYSSPPIPGASSPVGGFPLEREHTIKRCHANRGVCAVVRR